MSAPSSPWQKSFAGEGEGLEPRSRSETAGEPVGSSRSRDAEIGSRSRTQAEMTSATGCQGALLAAGDGALTAPV